MISFLIDAILIVICICTTIFSMKQGFVRSVLSVIAVVASILISMVFTPVISDVLYENVFIDGITGGIKETVNSLAGSGSSEEIAEMLESNPDVLSKIYERYNVTDTMAEEMIDSAYAGDASVENISRTIASPVASTISNVLAFALCFVVTTILLKLIIMAIDAIFKFPVLNSANKLGGLALGIIMAVIVGFVYSVLITRLVNSLGSVAPELFGPDKIADTVLVKFLASGGLTEFINKVL